MKDYQDLLGKIAVAAAIIIAGIVVARAINQAAGSIGSQIAGAIVTLASQG